MEAVKGAMIVCRVTEAQVSQYQATERSLLPGRRLGTTALAKTIAQYGIVRVVSTLISNLVPQGTPTTLQHTTALIQVVLICNLECATWDEVARLHATSVEGRQGLVAQIAVAADDTTLARFKAVVEDLLMHKIAAKKAPRVAAATVPEGTRVGADNARRAPFMSPCNKCSSTSHIKKDCPDYICQGCGKTGAEGHHTWPNCPVRPMTKEEMQAAAGHKKF
jgi:hypothetical protein